MVEDVKNKEANNVTPPKENTMAKENRRMVQEPDGAYTSTQS